MICSNKTLLNKEVINLRNVFININDYPSQLVDQIINEELQKRSHKNIVTNDVETGTENNNQKEEKVQLLLPFNGKQGTQLLSKMKKHI